jgi:23S rRNA pseudouridine2605 synthase
MTTSRKDGRRPPAAGAARRLQPGRPKAPRAAAPEKPDGHGERIAKVMARAGLCSRREAEGWIAAGRVALNGAVLTSPAVSVRAGDRVLVDGAPLAQRERTRLFLFNKPRGLVTTDRDPEGRPTVFDHLRAHWPDGPRVVTVGRLDINTEGLLLLTNDGGLARVLELPATGWLRRYRVRANGSIDQPALDALKAGVTLDGVDYAGVEAALDRVQGANVWLTVALREGKNREVKRLLEHVGLFVNRLIRISFGPFQLGALGDGKVEEVRSRVLRDQLGPTLTAEAHADFTSPLAAPAPAAVPEPPRRERPAQRPTRSDGPRPPHGERPKDRAHGRGQDRTPDRPQDRAMPVRGGRPSRGGRPDAAQAEAPEPRRERPKGGPRKHVSALRAEAAAAQAGPRRRTERGATADRKGRPVVVERTLSARPPRAEKPSRPARANRPQNAERAGPRDARRPKARAEPGRPPRRDDKPPRREDRRNQPPRGKPPGRGAPARQEDRRDKPSRGKPPGKPPGRGAPPRRDGERPRPRR